jgi:peptide-methionine (S)-S-oxide reductase
MLSSPQSVATLGGGCFWCLEAAFEQVAGVKQVVSGYAGGRIPDPTYEQVCTGRTGHAEVVQITFDPAVISYRELLDIFFVLHDPTTPDRQGADAGPQYRSIILYHSDEQRRIAEATIRELDAAGLWPDPVITQVVPLTDFFPAEDYHQHYFQRNPHQPYCQFVVAPKVQKVRQKFSYRLKRSPDS